MLWYGPILRRRGGSRRRGRRWGGGWRCRALRRRRRGGDLRPRSPSKRIEAPALLLRSRMFGQLSGGRKAKQQGGEEVWWIFRVWTPIGRIIVRKILFKEKCERWAGDSVSHHFCHTIGTGWHTTRDETGALPLWSQNASYIFASFFLSFSFFGILFFFFSFFFLKRASYIVLYKWSIQIRWRSSSWLHCRWSKVLPNRKTAIDRPDLFLLFFTKYTPQKKVFSSNNMPLLFYLQNTSINIYPQIRAHQAKVQCTIHLLIYNTTAFWIWPKIDLFTSLRVWTARRQQGTWWQSTNKTCVELCLSQGSSRMARAKFDARVNLTELNAWLGRWLFEKSGRSLASDSSCSLLSNKIVSATFIRGLGLQLSSSIWT